MRKALRLVVISLILLLSTTTAPAMLHPDCNNQPGLQCGTTCTSEGCSFIIWGDPDKMFSYCYVVDGSGCLGGYHHPCCD